MIGLPGRPVVVGRRDPAPPRQPHQVKGRSWGILMRRPVTKTGRTRTYRDFSPGAQGVQGQAPPDAAFLVAGDDEAVGLDLADSRAHLREHQDLVVHL